MPCLIGRSSSPGDRLCVVLDWVLGVIGQLARSGLADGPGRMASPLPPAPNKHTCRVATLVLAALGLGVYLSAVLVDLRPAGGALLRAAWGVPTVPNLDPGALFTDALARAPAPSHCGRTYPLPGVFRADSPPYFFPNASTGCPPAPVLTPTAWLTCLARRRGRLFIMGNSLGRGIAYMWQSVLNGMTRHADRAAQKAACAKSPSAHNTDNIASCVLDVGVPPALNGSGSGTSSGSVRSDAPLSITPEDAAVRFLWRPTFWNTSWEPYDFCNGKAPGECYGAFFSPESREGDVLVIQTGLGFVEKQHLAPRMIDDFRDFMASGVFRGTVVWLSSPLAHPDKSWGGFNVYIDPLMDALAPVVIASGARVVDFRRFADGVSATNAFSDAIHPPLVFYEAVVHAAAAQVEC